MMRRLIVASFALVVLLQASRSIAEPQKITLRDALAYARRNQPAIRAAFAEVRAAEAEARVPGSQWYPRIGVGAELFAATSNNTTASTLGLDVLDVPRIGGSRVVSRGTLRPYPSTFVAVGARQELFEFGRIAAEQAAADAEVSARRYAADADWLDMALAVEEAYFAVQTAKAIERTADDNYRRASLHRDYAKSGVASGLRPAVDLARAEADLAKADSDRARAHAGVATARVGLAAAIGAAALEVDTVDEVEAGQVTPTLTEALNRAERVDPRIRSAIEQARAIDLRADAIGAELLPDLSATATLSGRAGGAPPSGNGERATGAGYAPDVPNWDVGLVFSWPIFDGTVIARRDAARARAEAARYGVEVARENARAAVRRAYVDLRAARDIVPNLERARDAARANADQAEARFKNGLGTSVELADAEALLADAEIRLALGRFDVARARAQLGRAAVEQISPPEGKR